MGQPSITGTSVHWVSRHWLAFRIEFFRWISSLSNLLYLAIVCLTSFVLGNIASGHIGTEFGLNQILSDTSLTLQNSYSYIQTISPLVIYENSFILPMLLLRLSLLFVTKDRLRAVYYLCVRGDITKGLTVGENGAAALFIETAVSMTAIYIFAYYADLNHTYIIRELLFISTLFFVTFFTKYIPRVVFPAICVLFLIVFLEPFAVLLSLHLGSSRMIRAQDAVESLLAYAYGLYVLAILLSLLIGIRLRSNVWPVIAMIVACGVIWRINVTNSDSVPFKYKFDGFVTSNGVDLYSRLVSIHHAGEAPVHFHSPVALLERWKQSLASKAKPKLIIITASGGGYKAAYWTAAVLDQMLNASNMQTGLRGIGNNICLLTGASGGTIAEAYFVTSRARGGRPAHILYDMMNEMGRRSDAKSHSNATIDSLTPILMQLLRGDIFHIFRDSALYDRGKALEDQWPSLNVSFSSIFNTDQSPPLPSLIISPVMVETGAPLLISDLDLHEMPMVIKERAHELFRLFPDIDDHFKVKTAVRMNATFPYISPATELPLQERYRIADAGFFDNYGVVSAVEYLAQRSVREWILTNTSGVIIVQIRAFPTSEEAQHNLASYRWEWLSAPVDSLLSSRRSAMIARNEIDLELINNSYGYRVETCAEKEYQLNCSGQKFIDTVVFQTNVSASLSWFLTSAELTALQADVGKHQESWQKLQTLWESPTP